MVLRSSGGTVVVVVVGATFVGGAVVLVTGADVDGGRVVDDSTVTLVSVGASAPDEQPAPRMPMAAARTAVRPEGRRIEAPSLAERTP